MSEETDEQASAPILFVGAGRIGLPIALRLAARGFEVHACDASPDTLAELARRGVRALGRDAIARLTHARVILCLPEPAAAGALLRVWVERGLPPGAIIADITTMAPATARLHAALVAEAGGAYLDLPVSGGQRGAQNGEMVVLAGGSRAAFEAMLPVLEAIGTTVHHVGEAGTASQVKAVHQHVYLSFNLAFAEGLRLGRELGLPEQAIMDVLTKGAAAHPLINDRLPVALGSDFREGFALKRCLKDLDCLELPVHVTGEARAAHERISGIVREAVTAGLGDLDILALSRGTDSGGRGG